jgi:hypothetical protein
MSAATRCTGTRFYAENTCEPILAPIVTDTSATATDHTIRVGRAEARKWSDTMSATKVLQALALLAGIAVTANVTATPSLAQSQPNYGPNSPGGGDTYGEPYSGSAAARRRSGGW